MCINSAYYRFFMWFLSNLMQCCYYVFVILDKRYYKKKVYRLRLRHTQHKYIKKYHGF